MFLGINGRPKGKLFKNVSAKGPESLFLVASRAKKHDGKNCKSPENADDDVDDADEEKRIYGKEIKLYILVYLISLRDDISVSENLGKLVTLLVLLTTRPELCRVREWNN